MRWIGSSAKVRTHLLGSFARARWDRAFRRSACAAAVIAVLSSSELAAQGSAKALYVAAQNAEQRLHRSQELLAAKSEWVRVAKLYRKVVATHPQSGYCDDALYFEAELYREIDRRFGADGDAVERALDSYLLLANGYPSSKWARKARLTRGKVYLERLSDRKNASIELRKVTSLWPQSAEGLEAQRLLDSMTRLKRAARESEELPPGVVAVKNVRHWTSKEKEYTRIVIDLDDEVTFAEGRVEDPDRIFFDLRGTRLAKDLAARKFLIEDGFLRQIRVGQNRPDVVRVVLDFDSISEYKVFWLPDPYRLVVDILGTEPTAKAPSASVADNAPGATASSPEAGPAAASGTNLRLPPSPTRDGSLSVSRQLALHANRVVIDPGHGGHDPGTSRGGLVEKDVVLDISRRVAKLLEDDFDVLMTRDSDIFIPLEERTAIANTKGGDLFVSIHLNAARSARPGGTETYYLNLATTPDAAEVAARENAVTTRRLGELQSLLQKVMNNSRILESRDFATHVQDTLAEQLYTSKKDSRNRGVKTAPFYVLLGAQIPSILVEVAYVTNANDASSLNKVAFRQKVAESIAAGIRSYHRNLAPTMRIETAAAHAGSTSPY
ncbi:MAG TPA: N-acetylmuramoyl-L-alanine amidase [Vicinamibacteria bacterium]|nr:N-acetylmuramoyl-L-alanine amidase [Vicinamibacteria bacterium]